MRLFDLPDFLSGNVSRQAYVRWLQRKAVAHVRRDRQRGNDGATISEYKKAIHKAVCSSSGRDAYTGEPLSWKLISTYDNRDSERGRRGYKARFALLPTVDHIGDGTGPAHFRICAWRTNDAKADLSLENFVALCTRVVEANPRLVKGPSKPASIRRRSRRYEHHASHRHGCEMVRAELQKRGFDVVEPSGFPPADLDYSPTRRKAPAKGIPMKIFVSTKPRFTVFRELRRIRGLVLGYVWLQRDAPAFHFMTFGEAEAMLGAKARATASWNRGKRWYSTTTIPPDMGNTQDRWAWLERKR